MRETDGFELASTITLVLQANRLTKCHFKNLTADIPAKTTRESEPEPSNVRTREQLISQQDQLFETSLKVDQEKEKEKLAMDELINFKIRKHFAMKRFIEKNPEPSLSENCALVVVHHINLGRIDRFFSNSDIFETMYCWMGSLQIDPEYFVLALDRPYYVFKPSDSVLKAERRLLMMLVCELAQFHFSHRENDLNESSNNPLINCPVCGKKQEASEIETHAARCADAKYIEVFDSESEASNV